MCIRACTSYHIGMATAKQSAALAWGSRNIVLRCSLRECVSSFSSFRRRAPPSALARAAAAAARGVQQPCPAPASLRRPDPLTGAHVSPPPAFADRIPTAADPMLAVSRSGHRSLLSALARKRKPRHAALSQRSR